MATKLLLGWISHDSVSEEHAIPNTMGHNHWWVFSHIPIFSMCWIDLNHDAENRTYVLLLSLNDLKEEISTQSHIKKTRQFKLFSPYLKTKQHIQTNLLTFESHMLFIASVIARETTYCKRGTVRPSSICNVKENRRQPLGDSHLFLDRPAICQYHTNYIPNESNILTTMTTFWTSSFELNISNTYGTNGQLTKISAKNKNRNRYKQINKTQWRDKQNLDIPMLTEKQRRGSKATAETK